MHLKTMLVVATVVVALSACAAYAVDVTFSWGQSSAGYVNDSQAANRQANLVFRGQTGTTTDSDLTTAFNEPNGNTYHIQQYTTLDLTQFGVPATAKYATFGIKAIITKGDQTGVADVFAFMRAPGSTCCQGLPSAPNYPIDSGFGQVVEGMAQQAVSYYPHDGQRSWSQITEPIVNGQVEFSWGYTKVAGQFPTGDALAIDVYLDGYYL